MFSTTHAQTASDLNEGCRVVKMPATNEYEFSWWSKTGRTYFVQTSLDLVNWTFLEDIVTGADQVASCGINSPAPRLFFRLRHTNQTAVNPATADFDGDGLDNLTEIKAVAAGGSDTDPLDADMDDDTWLDGIEHESGSLPRDAASTPMTVALARINALQSAITAYVTLRQSGNGTYAQLSAMHSALTADWATLQALLDDIDAAMPGQPTAPMRPGTPSGGPGGAPPLAGAPPAAPPEPHSTGHLIGRWVTSAYSDIRDGMAYGDWNWHLTFDEDGLPTGGEWQPVDGSANLSWDEATRVDGTWAQSGGTGGENLTLAEAMNRDQSVEPGELLPGEVFTSASGS
jgi:hypothetical protein